MKRIYLLMAAVVGLTSAAQAQRSVDLKLTSINPAGVVVISEDEDQNPDAAFTGNDFQYTVENVGTEDFLATDSIVLGVWWSGSYAVLGRTAGIPAGQTWSGIGASDIGFNYNANITESGTNTVNLCDTLFMIDQAENIVADPDIANNRSCNDVVFHYWYLNVGNVNADGGAKFYPNPATNWINISTNFTNAKNANVVIRDVVGKVVMNKNLGQNLNGSKIFKVDINSLANGNYIVELNVDGKREMSKISVQK